MSAAPARREINREFVMVPNEMVENLAALTHSELAFALIVMKRATKVGEAITISDATWKKWTGLTSRSKDLAIKGLRSKGLEITGRGESALYSFNRQGWQQFVKSSPIKGKAKTEKPVAPKRGAKVHPDCRQRGCALLSIGDAKQISQTCAGQDSQAAPAKPGNAKYISHPLTFAAIAGFFPLVGIDFLAKLISCVAATVQGATDEEIAESVAVSYRRAQSRRGGQQSEGLFLWTVPEAVQAVRRARSQRDQDRIDSAKNRLQRIEQTVRNAGRGFEQYASELAQLRHSMAADVSVLNGIEERLSIIEGRVFDHADCMLSHTQRKEILERVQSNVDFLLKQLSPSEVESLRLAQLHDYTLAAFDIRSFALE